VTGVIKVDHEGEIKASLEDVFAFVSDGERLPAWMAGVKRARRTSPPGPLGAGTAYIVVGKVLGRRVESTYELTEFEPRTSFAARLRSPFFTVDDIYTFTASEGTTTVRRSVEAVPLGSLRLLGPVLAMSMQRQVKNDHRRLARVLERSRRRPAPRARIRPEAPTPVAEATDGSASRTPTGEAQGEAALAKPEPAVNEQERAAEG
jgi:hypothetical protein